MSALDSDGVRRNKLVPLKLSRYHSRRGAWKHLFKKEMDEMQENPPLSELVVVSWNVDYLERWPAQRMEIELKHLEEEELQCRNGEAPDPCIILLQEVHPRALPAILKNEWVQKHFFVTPSSCSKWPEKAPCGVVTLIQREVRVVKADMLWFAESDMNRMALITDVALDVPSRDNEEMVIRIVNTHLESLAEPQRAERYARRAAQLKLLTNKFLKDKEVDGGIIAGDMNALNQEDKELPAELGLGDAWLRGDDVPSGWTWGYQGGGMYPKNRLDKILFLPNKDYRLEEPGRIGKGLTYSGMGEEVYVSDHFGLVTTLEIVGD